MPDDPLSPMAQRLRIEIDERWAGQTEGIALVDEPWISRENTPTTTTEFEGVYDGLDVFEEPLIDFTSRSTTPATSHTGHSPMTGHMGPLVPANKSEEEIADDMALECSLMELGTFELSKLPPSLQRQVSLALRGHMPSHSEPPDLLGPITPQPRIKKKAVSSSLPPHVQEFNNFAGEAVKEEEDEWCCPEAQHSGALQSFCGPCNFTFCDRCWDQERAHKRLRGQTSTGVPHEKTDPIVAKKIEKTLKANHNFEEQAMLHVQDEDTSWFGTGKDEQENIIVFQDYGRYANLMAERAHRSRKIRYPSLVSFVGQTGAGKSTLIRLLIELHSPPDKKKPQVPVVGSIHHPDTPTSGDVHLYSDPSTSASECPILYADCEGLDGGEREPMGAKSRNKKRWEGSGGEPKKRTSSFAKHIRRKHNTSEREVLWADSDTTRSREYHVRNLYPRLLYTFSDLIFFVIKNPRVIESVVEQLISWAEAALQTSSNQPVLPHAIIVLNACDNNTDPKLWNVDHSTLALFESVRRAVDQNPKLRKYADFWRDMKRPIESVDSLLLSYYSSIRVVRVPEKGRPKLINEQLERLYAELLEATRQSRRSKHKLRMLLSSDELQPYLQYAFDHFCRDLDTPFDFVQASFANNPIPSDFGGNILKLAISVMEVWRDKLDGPKIFKELSFMVASCIMLEAARHRTLGPAENLFPKHLEHADDALDDFCDRYWPCEHATARGRCVNVKAGHSKGHQLQSGQILSTGEYFSTFSAESYRTRFRNDIYTNLKFLLDKLQDATQESDHLELLEAINIHRDTVLKNFYQHCNGAKNFISHTACYSCLISHPEHALPCGHVLCTPCVKVYGQARGRGLIDMKYCPLHPEEPAGDFRRSPWPIFIKPTEAGIRVLTLDGGGIRGIVELTILQQIENALGEGLRIQSFFDLIIGTSTGGIISLGLGSMGWPVDKCMSHFESLCRDAFHKRKGVGWPGIDFLVSASNHSRYQTKPLEDALKYAFGGEHLFGGLRDLSNPEIMSTVRTRVAVTTTTTSGSVFLLANYNRINTVASSPYQFHRSEKPRDEIKIWEAARATSAAPRIFKPFDHVNSGQQFQDGAIYHNNPIALAMRERQLIWPEMAEMNPDIVLSIGTSFNPNSKRGQIDPRSRFGMLAHAKQLAKIAIDHVLSTLNSEQTWQNYIQSLPSDKVRERYIRLNLQLRDDPPRLYEVDMMHELREMTQSRFTKQKEQIVAVANRLIATLFYFEPSASEAHENEDHTVTLTGSIVCRFAPGSEEMRALGGAFHKRSIAAYRQTDSRHDPYFVISEQRREKEAQQIVIGDHVIDKMMRDGRFSLGQVTLTLSNKVAETEISLCFADRRDNPAFYPISGFPRCLLQAGTRLSAKSRSSLNLARKRTPTSLNRGTWSLPSLLITHHDPIQRYEAEDYLYPGDATSDAISEISQRFSSPEPTQADFPQHSVASMNESAYQLNAQELDSTVIGPRVELPANWGPYSPQWQPLPPRAPTGTTPEKRYEMG